MSLEYEYQLMVNIMDLALENVRRNLARGEVSIGTTWAPDDLTAERVSLHNEKHKDEVEIIFLRGGDA